MKDYTKNVITTKSGTKITIIQKNCLPVRTRISDQYLNDVKIIRAYNCLNGPEILIARDNMNLSNMSP